MKVKNSNLYLIVILFLSVLVIYSINISETYYNNNPFSNDPYATNTNNNTNNNTTLLGKGLSQNSNTLLGKGTENFTTGFQNGGNSFGNFLTQQYPGMYDNPYMYPNTVIPPPVIGCGGRRGACMGGSEIPIPNTLPPVNISDANIAPINLTVRGFDEGIQQVGTIQQVFSRDNFVYPLFGRKRFRNDNKWDYFVKFGQYGVILPIVPLRNYEELNTNDEVHIQGQNHRYRVTMYDEDIPQYLPFA